MKRRSYLALILIATLAVGMIMADNVLKFGVTKTMAGYLTPVGIVVSDSGSTVSSFFRNLRDIAGLQNENKELNDKLNEAIAEIARLSDAQKENDALKNDLKFKKEYNYDLVSAHIIFFDPTNIRETITVSVGKDDGVKEGDVVVSQGFLVGKIVSLGTKSSKILLISDPRSAVPVNVVNLNVSGIAKGKIGSGMTLEQVPQSDKVSVGDFLTTSGLGGQYPKGLLLGKIEAIQQVSGSIFQAIEVRPMIDLGRLERVMIIKG